MNKISKLLISLIPLASITACQIDKPATPEDKGYVIKNRFDSIEAAKQILTEGSSTIEGNAFLRQKGGGIVTCAGSNVHLLPYTEYTNEVMSVFYGNSTKSVVSPFRRVKFVNGDSSYRTYMKETVCDSDGKFKFSDLKEGIYFITTSVTWKVPYKSATGYYHDRTEGGYLMQKVQITKGKTKSIVLSN